MDKYILYLGIFAGVCTATSMLPQLVKIIRKKKADDISVGMLVILLSGVAAWIAYGICKKDYPIIITNSASFIINLCIIIFSLKYKQR